MVLKDTTIRFGGYDLSSDHNEIAIARGAESLDATRFRTSGRQRRCGLMFWAFSGGGLVDLGDEGADEVLWGKVGLGNTLASFSPEDFTAGDVVHFGLANVLQYEPGAEVGKLYKFSIEGEGMDDILRGTVMENRAASNDGTGTPRELGAVSDTQKLYAGLHVLSATGSSPTLGVEIESDNAEGFSDPTTRGTFAQQTYKNGVYLTPVSGPFADTWWRITWTIGGSTPSFLFAVELAIK